MHPWNVLCPTQRVCHRRGPSAYPTRYCTQHSDMLSTSSDGIGAGDRYAEDDTISLAEFLAYITTLLFSFHAFGAAVRVISDGTFPHLQAGLSSSLSSVALGHRHGALGTRTQPVRHPNDPCCTYTDSITLASSQNDSSSQHLPTGSLADDFPLFKEETSRTGEIYP